MNIVCTRATGSLPFSKLGASCAAISLTERLPSIKLSKCCSAGSEGRAICKAGMGRWGSKIHAGGVETGKALSASGACAVKVQTCSVRSCADSGVFKYGVVSTFSYSGLKPAKVTSSIISVVL